MILISITWKAVFVHGQKISGLVQVAAQVVASAIYTVGQTQTLLLQLRRSRSLNDREDIWAVRCLTIKETGDGWSVDAEGSRDGLVFTLVLNAALWMKGDMWTTKWSGDNMNEKKGGEGGGGCTALAPEGQKEEASLDICLGFYYTREHSSAKIAAGPVFSSGSMRHLHLRLLKLSIFFIFKWNLPNREAYSQPSLSASSGRCCKWKHKSPHGGSTFLLFLELYCHLAASLVNNSSSRGPLVRCAQLCDSLWVLEAEVTR